MPALLKLLHHKTLNYSCFKTLLEALLEVPPALSVYKSYVVVTMGLVFCSRVVC